MVKIAAAKQDAHLFSEFVANSDLIASVVTLFRDFGSRDLQDPRTHDRLKISLLNDIADKKPFSLLRLGDGEGNILFWGLHKDEYPSLARLCMDRIWGLMFGCNLDDDSLFDELYVGMSEAIENSNYVGVPIRGQVSGALAKLQRVMDEECDIRGMAGTVGVWDWFDYAAAKFLPKDITVVNCHVHKSILGFFEDLIRCAGNVSIISCYPEVMGLLHSRCDINVGETFLIPPQAVNIGGTPGDEHFPKRFKELQFTLRSQARHGQLFFVGAGLAGKLYCESIRQAGGMAIDVGSIMDVWMGLGVRPYQDVDFVDKYKLMGPK